MSIALLEPYIQSAIDRCQCKALGTTESVKGFGNSCFIKRPCLKFDFYPVSIACLQSEIDSGES